MIITLAEAKAHLNVTDTADDALITSYVKAAEEYVAGFNLDCPMTPAEAPEGVKLAIKLRAARYFHDREAGLIDAESRTSDVAIDVHDLIAPYRKWAF